MTEPTPSCSEGATSLPSEFVAAAAAEIAREFTPTRWRAGYVPSPDELTEVVDANARQIAPILTDLVAEEKRKYGDELVGHFEDILAAMPEYQKLKKKIDALMEGKGRDED